MSSSVNTCETSSENGNQEESSIILSTEVQVVSRNEEGGGKSNRKPNTDQSKTGESNSSISPIQPVGAGRPQNPTTKLRKQKNQEKSAVELLRKALEKSGDSKNRNNQQKMAQQSNLNRGSSQTSLTGKMNSMSISDSRWQGQGGLQKKSISTGQSNHSQQNQGQNNGRIQNHWQQVVSQSNFQCNNRSPVLSHQNQASYAPNGSCSNSLNQIHPGSPTDFMHRQAFPPPHPGNEFYVAHRSAPNSPGPMNSIGHNNMRPDPLLWRSPSVPGHEHLNNTFLHHVVPNVVSLDFVQSPPPCINGRPNDRIHVSPPNSNYERPNYLDRRCVEHGYRQKNAYNKLHNGNVKGNPSPNEHNHKKQENKAWKRNDNQASVKYKRKSYPATASQGSPVPNTNDMGPITSAVPQYFRSQDVFVSQPSFVPLPNSIPPPMSPVTTAPFQQYSVAFYQGGNFMPHQQWVPVTEGQGNFVPYTSAEMVPYTGVTPHGTVPYSVPPNVLPFPNGQAVTPYTTIPHTPGVSSHGFVPSMQPPANVNTQVLSFTVSSRVGSFTANSEVPNHQFKLSQLERAWEGNPSQQTFEHSGPAQSAENISSRGDEPSHQHGRAGGEPPQIGAEWLPEKLKKMLDVSSLEKLQRMSSANGKRAPMNARSKDSPNHVPAATPPDVQEEVIKFICDSWNKVYQEYQKGSPAVAYHVESDPCTLPEGFVPFDLEAYWGKRLVQNMTTQNIPTQNM